MPKKTNLITVPEQNKHYKGSEFKRWDSLVTRFLKDHPDYGVNSSANSKKGERNNDRR